MSSPVFKPGDTVKLKPEYLKDELFSSSVASWFSDPAGIFEIDEVWGNSERPDEDEELEDEPWQNGDPDDWKKGSETPQDEAQSVHIKGHPSQIWFGADIFIPF